MTGWHVCHTCHISLQGEGENMVSQDTLRIDVWDEVYNYITDTNEITNSDKVYSSFNDKLVKDEGYPLIIIYPANVSYEPITANGSIVNSEASMLIQVYSNSAENVKSVADNVTTKLLAGRETFAGKRLTKLSIEEGDYDRWSNNNRTIHRVSFNITFKYRSE